GVGVEVEGRAACGRPPPEAGGGPGERAGAGRHAGDCLGEAAVHRAAPAEAGTREARDRPGPGLHGSNAPPGRSTEAATRPRAGTVSPRRGRGRTDLRPTRHPGDADAAAGSPAAAVRPAPPRARPSPP